MSASRETVVVTGLGATTPLGGDVASTWAGMLAGRSGVRSIEEPWAADLPVRFAAQAAVDPVEIVGRVPARRMDRCEQFALVTTLDPSMPADGRAILPRDPRERLAALFDPGTLELLPADGHEHSGVVAGVGLVHGAGAVAFACDPRLQGGAMGTAGCAAIVGAYTEAVSRGVPIVGLWHSGGARLAEGVASLHAVGTVFAAMTAASGRVPQISVVLGPAAGGAAYGPALTDIVILSGQGRLFVTGPDVVRSVTGEDVDAERLGGPEPHSRRSGVVHVVTETDADAHGPGPPARRHCSATTARVQAEDAEGRGSVVGLLPESARRAYDVHVLTGNQLLDAPGRRAAPPVGAEHRHHHSGRWAGRTVGVVASNPLRLGGCLDAASARRRHASSGCATRSECRSSCWWTCPATCPAWARSGTAWSAAGLSCCTPSARPCPG